ncbi:MAG: hypothetical protein CO128_05815 [Ignavibacteriales bacterium CG_4_9_14_3_um_filter_30_11]|nr:MAG: hypothetical protein CO128_05815 [Ignavibacteriales bacterium CG_4_9_14_3_um_filter_30_11]
MLYSNPIVNSNDVAVYLRVAPATANSLIQDFIKLGILSEITGGKRYRLFNFENYMKLFTKSDSLK